MDYAEYLDGWCDAGFGPNIWVSYRCRLLKGHDGPHRCPAADGNGFTDPGPPTQKELADTYRSLGAEPPMQ